MATDVGALYRTSIEVRDANGTLINPSTKTVVITLPDGTTASPTIVSDGVGMFHADYPIAQEGLHRVVWSTTAPVTSKTDYENGIAYRSVVGLTEVREYLNISDTSKDDLLRLIMASATELAESITGTLCVRTYTNDHCPGSQRPAIRLPHGPLPDANAVTSVSSVWPGGPTWASAALMVYPDSGIVEPVDMAGFWMGPWKATYKAGRLVIPQRWVEAVKEIIYDLWANQRGQLHDPLVPTYEDSTEYAARIPLGYEMPARAKAMLKRGSQPGFAQMATTAIGDVINAIVAALTPVMAPVPVFDGTPKNIPAEVQYVIIGGEIEPDAEVADMDQDWHGLGLMTRYENIHIKCVAVGRAATPREARDLSLAVIEIVGANLPVKPTSTTYNALIGSVDRMTAPRSQAGITNNTAFTILVKARLLTP